MRLSSSKLSIFKVYHLLSSFFTRYAYVLHFLIYFGLDGVRSWGFSSDLADSGWGLIGSDGWDLFAYEFLLLVVALLSSRLVLHDNGKFALLVADESSYGIYMLGWFFEPIPCFQHHSQFYFLLQATSTKSGAHVVL